MEGHQTELPSAASSTAENQSMSVADVVKNCKHADAECVELNSASVSSTSITSLMVKSQFGQVVFHDLDDVYLTDCDLHCRYTLNEGVSPMPRDRIALYKVGWKSITDYIVLKLAPMPLLEKDFARLRISFAASTLPKDDDELYQLCYLSHNDFIMGASIPFSFRPPHERDLVVIEDKNNSGLMVLKSRVSLLHDKIAKVEEEKDIAELKVCTLSDQVAILEKEMHLISDQNNELTKSSQESALEIVVLKSDLFRAQENVEKLQRECDDYKTKVDEMKLKCEKLTKENESNEKKICTISKEIEKSREISSTHKISEEDMKLKYLSLEKKNCQVEEKMNTVLKQFNELQQSKCLAELTLNELRCYCGKLKCELDKCKQQVADDIMIKENLNKEIATLKEVRPQQQQQPQTSELSAPETAHSNMNDEDVQVLQTQLQSALHLLDETIKKQQILESNAFETKEFEETIKYAIEKQSAEHVDKINALENALVLKENELEKLREELKVEISKKETIENCMKDVIQQNVDVAESNITLSKQVEEGKRREGECLEQLTTKIKELEKIVGDKEQQTGELINKVNEYELKIAKQNCASPEKHSVGKSTNKDEDRKEELEQLVICMREALNSESSFEETYKIILESTRVTAMTTFKDLFGSIQFLNFENTDIYCKVRRLLDEFSILNQDLIMCRQEKKGLYETLGKLKVQECDVTKENEINKMKVEELTELVNEMKNCIEVFKKGSGETQQLKNLRNELDEMTKMKIVIEKQLKEIKAAQALTNIGFITVTEKALSAEVQRLSHRVRELEANTSGLTVSSPLKNCCCEKLQAHLKRSAAEYAKLYNQMMTDKIHYERFLATLPQFSSLSSSSTSEIPSGLPSENSS